jgi:5-methyltetrahydrofolate--homocysteine methyltransferase
VLGVSNISFGLPNRELVNQAFLTMALNNGLDLPIINPNITAMTGAFRAFKLLAGFDNNSMEFIENYSDVTVKTVLVPNGANVNVSTGNTTVTSDKDNSDNKNVSDGNELHNKLSIAIEKGLKSEGINIAKELLKDDDYDPMILINNVLIPALDKTGAMFEKGKIFLPQLILSASVAQGCFEAIKDKMNKIGGQSVSKGKIILATVKGDIHDIGKNIVKVLLENYGYTVIDLGKDVEYQAVVDAAIQHEAKLVGLSALMTTTLVSMEETIKLLKENNVDCKVVVGGAVLTEDYAKKIGADFYAKDAKESVDVAKKVLGE